MKARNNNGAPRSFIVRRRLQRARRRSVSEQWRAKGVEQTRNHGRTATPTCPWQFLSRLGSSITSSVVQTSITWTIKVVPPVDYKPRFEFCHPFPTPPEAAGRRRHILPSSEGLTTTPYISSPFPQSPGLPNSRPTRHELILQEEAHLSHFYHHRSNNHPS